MIRHQAGDLVYLQFENLVRYKEIIHAISTRHGGVSNGIYRSLNMSFSVGDATDNVVSNRAILCRALNIPAEAIVVPQLAHSCNVAVVSSNDKGQGALRGGTGIPVSDALITDSPGLFLLITFADCVPLLFYDPVKRAVGLAHAGWKGTVNQIARHVVGKMTQDFGTDPADLIIGIGPSIGPCCYEVGDEVMALVSRAWGDHLDDVAHQVDGRRHLDLWNLNHHAILEAGVNETHLEVTRICTSCRVGDFFSHRRERGRTGRFAAIIGLH
ncbi:MAG: peptidoglycan editing factor PgeF [Chloroflexi bacterium]|nr:peptidoglycan editing factor PgeF [Chloroflexota bacterium]MCL5075637.1 peptidoglycan editing factor PgeF [Chloroflexota bacterium]